MSELLDIYQTPDVPLVPCPLDFTGLDKMQRSIAYYRWLVQLREFPPIQMKSKGTLLQISTEPPTVDYCYIPEEEDDV